MWWLHNFKFKKEDVSLLLTLSSRNFKYLNSPERVVVKSACNPPLQLSDSPMHVVTIRSVLIVRTVYKAVHPQSNPRGGQESSGATSTRPFHLCTLRTAVEQQHHLTPLPEDMAVAINQ